MCVVCSGRGVCVSVWCICVSVLWCLVMCGVSVPVTCRTGPCDISQLPRDGCALALRDSLGCSGSVRSPHQDMCLSACRAATSWELCLHLRSGLGRLHRLSPPGCCTVGLPQQGLLAPRSAGGPEAWASAAQNRWRHSRHAPREALARGVQQTSSQLWASRKAECPRVVGSGVWWAGLSAPALGLFPSCPVPRAAGVPWLFLAAPPCSLQVALSRAAPCLSSALCVRLTVASERRLLHGPAAAFPFPARLGPPGASLPRRTRGSVESRGWDGNL